MSRTLARMAAVVGLLVAGCGAHGPSQEPQGGGDIPITHRGIAAIALEHAPKDTTKLQAAQLNENVPVGTLGADLRYKGDGEDDGNLLRVRVGPAEGKPCEGADGCDQRKVDRGRLTIAWDEVEPEEDPGYVEVVLERDGQAISARWSGDEITGDPRKQHLTIPVSTLEDIVLDERLGLKTSQAVIDAGKGLKRWAGGEPDPKSTERVPTTDEAVAAAYMRMGAGVTTDYSDLRPSPLRSEFGPKVVGGRFRSKAGGKPMLMDVLASPDRPSWLAPRPCATKRFAGHCERYDGRLGPQYLMWVPGVKGEVWILGLRPNETVAVRMTGWDIPIWPRSVEIDTKFESVRFALDDRGLGPTTTRRGLKIDLEIAQKVR